MAPLGRCWYIHIAETQQTEIVFTKSTVEVRGLLLLSAACQVNKVGPKNQLYLFIFGGCEISPVTHLLFGHRGEISRFVTSCPLF